MNNFDQNFDELDVSKETLDQYENILENHPKTLKERFLHLFKATDGKSRAVSLYEFLLMFVLFPVIIISTQNLFVLYIWVGLLLKYLPETILKEGVSNLESMKGYAKRPGGVNCNMFNEGGPALNSGIISGHVVIISSLSWFFLFKMTEGFTEKPNAKKILFVLFLFGWTLIVMKARHSLKCHTLQQVLFGLIFGFVWGVTMYYIYREIRKK
jgi:membrane-associated phospholipid phosphatase